MRNVSKEKFTNLINQVVESKEKWQYEKAIIYIRHLDYLRFKEIINENKDYFEVNLRNDLPSETTCYIRPIFKGEKYDKLQKLW